MFKTMALSNSKFFFAVVTAISCSLIRLLRWFSVLPSRTHTQLPRPVGTMATKSVTSAEDADTSPKIAPHERFSLPTKYATCRTCGQEGHSRADCPSRQCKRCYVIGHSANECTAPYCTRCRQPGHSREGCNSAPPKCDDCGGVHPTIHCELFTNKKRKRGNQ
ncbi:hypothetical protein V8C40DRAFT_228768 [Trichoderma camerunense]